MKKLCRFSCEKREIPTSLLFHIFLLATGASPWDDNLWPSFIMNKKYLTSFLSLFFSFPFLIWKYIGKYIYILESTLIIFIEMLFSFIELHMSFVGKIFYKKFHFYQTMQEKISIAQDIHIEIYDFVFLLLTNDVCFT